VFITYFFSTAGDPIMAENPPVPPPEDQAGPIAHPTAPVMYQPLPFHYSATPGDGALLYGLAHCGQISWDVFHAYMSRLEKNADQKSA